MLRMFDFYFEMMENMYFDDKNDNREMWKCLMEYFYDCGYYYIMIVDIFIVFDTMGIIFLMLFFKRDSQNGWSGKFKINMINNIVLHSFLLQFVERDWKKKKRLNEWKYIMHGIYTDTNLIIFVLFTKLVTIFSLKFLFYNNQDRRNARMLIIGNCNKCTSKI